MVDMTDVPKLDPSWTRIISEYPRSSLPKKLNKRTGKAKNSLFEELDVQLYEKGANMVTFHTDIHRLYPWIKTLDSFYYNHLGKCDEFNINWYDDPEIWENPSDNANSIVIEIRDNTNTLVYSIIFFVTTGTIRAQGSKYMLFVEKHFPILKLILDKVLLLDLPEATEEEETLTHLKQPHSNVENRNENLQSKEKCLVDETHLNQPHSKAEKRTEYSQRKEKCMVDETYLKEPHSNENWTENLQRMEKSMVDAIQKIQLSHEKDIGSLITIVNQNRDDCVKKLDQLELSQKKGLAEMIKIVSQNKGDCPTQIQQCLAGIEEIKTNCNSLQKFKIDATAALEGIERQLKSPQSYSEVVKRSNREENLPISCAATTGPNVLLIGTSNIKGIKEDKLTPAATTTKIIKYTIDETIEYIQTCELCPDVVIFHSLTNDLTKMDPQACVDALAELIKIVKDKWINTTTIISLATPRLDNLGYHTNGQITNALIKQRITEVSYCDHSNMLKDGNPTPDYLSDDKYHLSKKGTSILAANIKKAIHTSLNIPMINRGRSRSRSRINSTRGRGRGYHYNSEHVYRTRDS